MIRSLLLAGLLMVQSATADSLWREIIRDFNLPDPPPDTRLMVEQSR